MPGLDDRIRERLSGKTAIVTGGAAGIGKAVCLRLALDGMRLAVVDLKEEAVARAVDELSEIAPGAVMGLALDVRSEPDMEEMARRVVERFEKVDLLVHSAGILRAKDSGPKILTQLSVREWDEVVETNLKGTFLCNRAVASRMMAQKSGQIINISSISGVQGRAFDSAYCSSKFGIVGLSESLAEEMRQYGVKVQLLLPDAVNTGLWEQNGPIKAPSYALDPDRVADLVRFIAGQPEEAVFGRTVITPFGTVRGSVRGG